MCPDLLQGALQDLRSKMGRKLEGVAISTRRMDLQSYPLDAPSSPSPRITAGMTVAARITQADMDRAAKAVKAAGFERARIEMDLANRKIVVIIGESDAAPEKNPFDEE